MTLKQDLKDASGGTLWVIGLGAVGIVVVLVLITMWTFGFGWWSKSTANFRGEVGVAEQTKANANFRIQAYDNFFNLCSAVQADEDRLEAQSSLLDQTTDQAERQRIARTMAAIQGSRGQKIRRYNANARKEWTVGQFRANDLPFALDPTQERTSCTV